jgi:hypothetical protein
MMPDRSLLLILVFMDVALEVAEPPRLARRLFAIGVLFARSV